MKKILLIILAAGCTMALVSCEEWLDKYPLAQMSPETFFSNENELQAFSNKFYTVFPSDGLYNEYWDNIIHNDLPQEMRGGRTIPASGGGWTWTDLRDINTLLEYSVNCKDLDVRNHYDALARFFRAYFYFEKIKRFGDVPWYAKPIGSADAELNRPRDSREYVMQRMIEDIDFAIRYLPTKHDLYRITKWTALALKSRFCLFEGTFRKYHDIDLPENDWKYYLSLSAKASEEFITNSGYGLYTSGGTQTAYRDLFVSEDAQQIEVVLARDYNKGLSVFHNSTFYSLNTSYGRPGLTRKIVASYLMADGTRFTDKAGWETMEFRDECRNPRSASGAIDPHAGLHAHQLHQGRSAEPVDLHDGLSAHQVRRSRRFRFRRVQPLVHRPADHPHGRDLPQLRRSQSRAGYADAGRHRSVDQETARSRRYAQSGHGSRQRQPRPVPFGP